MNHDALVIPFNELVARRDAMLQEMEHAKVDVAVITSAPSVYYLTGIEFGGYATRHALVLARDGGALLVVRAIEQGWQGIALERSWATEWVFYEDWEPWFDAVSGAVRKLHSDRCVIAAETSRASLSALEARQLAEQCSRDAIRDAAPMVEGLRAIKSDFEVDTMRRAGAATVAGTEAAWAAVSAGASDQDAAIEADRAMNNAGSGIVCDGPFVVSGASSALAHARASARIAQQGEVVSTMMSASIGRYQAPCERAFGFGSVDDHVAEALDLAAQATQAVINNLRPGITSHSADAVARNFWEQHNLSAGFKHRMGYSIGVAFPPLWWENDVMQLRPRDERLLVQGMTFHLVPGIHIAGLGFINQSMPVVITDTGCEPLIGLPLRMVQA